MTSDPNLPDHVMTIEIAAPVQQVWDEITKTGSVQRPLYNTVLESTLQPGAKLRYYSPDKKRVFVVGEVVEVDPPRRFVHTYMFTMRTETPTLVTWELTETETGCRVTLTHAGFTDQTETHKGVGPGWEEILKLLKAEVETGRIPLKTRVTYWVMGWLSFMLPKSTRTPEVEKAGW